LSTDDDALTRFARSAHAAWPAFARELEEASGWDIGFSGPGSLIVAQTEARAASLKRHAAMLGESRTRSEWLTRDNLLAREPLLSRNLHGALHVPDDAQVDNRVLGDALGAALARLSVPLHRNSPARALIVEGGRIRGIVTPSGALFGDAVILACGAWMNLLEGIRADELPPVKPAKGQMVALAPPDAVALPHCLIWDDEVYLAPRRDRIFIGATVEDAGFDTSVTREACRRLVAEAARIIPALAQWRIAEMWAGLRPRTPDSAPVLGMSGIAGLYVAGGQFRNGILFAPAVAEAISALILKEKIRPEIRAFDPRRFNALA
jgi:glycine oxidase